jgi:hypothetical protein
MIYTQLVMGALLVLLVAAAGCTTQTSTPLDATWQTGTVFLCPCVRDIPQGGDDVAATQPQGAKE